MLDSENLDYLQMWPKNTLLTRGSRLECWADKMGEISAMIGWSIFGLCFMCLPNLIKLSLIYSSLLLTQILNPHELSKKSKRFLFM